MFKSQLKKMYSSGYPPPGGEGMPQGAQGNGAPPGYNTPVSQPPPGLSRNNTLGRQIAYEFPLFLFFFKSSKCPLIYFFINAKKFKTFKIIIFFFSLLDLPCIT